MAPWRIPTKIAINWFDQVLSIWRLSEWSRYQWIILLTRTIANGHPRVVGQGLDEPSAKWLTVSPTCLQQISVPGMVSMQQHSQCFIGVQQLGQCAIGMIGMLFGIEQPLVLSHLILSTMPLLSYQMNYPTLQFGCYETALYLIFYI